MLMISVQWDFPWGVRTYLCQGRSRVISPSTPIAATAISSRAVVVQLGKGVGSRNKSIILYRLPIACPPRHSPKWKCSILGPKSAREFKGPNARRRPAAGHAALVGERARGVALADGGAAAQQGEGLGRPAEVAEKRVGKRCQEKVSGPFSTTTYNKGS